MTDQVSKEFEAFGTSAVSDALDRLGIAGQAHGIHPLLRSFRMVGRAYTGLYQPVDVAGGTVGDYIDDVPTGHVVVLDNRGRTDATVWGDILTQVASRERLAGTAIDGVCRDIDRSEELNYPIFSRGNWMRTGKDRVQLVSVQTPVTLGGVRVHPGDIVVGDGDGVVVVPAERELEVLDAVRAIEEAEQRIRLLVQDGAQLAEARRQLGYHRLQTPTPEE